MDFLPKESSIQQGKDISAFRIAEKFYKSQGLNAPGLLDFSKYLSKNDAVSNCDPFDSSSIAKIKIDYIVDDRRGAIPLCTITSRPGFIYIPSVFSTSEQKVWIKNCLSKYTSRDNRTNFTVDHLFENPYERASTSSPKNSSSNNFWEWLEQKQETREEPTQLDNKQETRAQCLTAWKKGAQEEMGYLPVSLARGNWLRRLRWATLGFHYDWTRKIYSKDDFSEFPVDLYQLTAEIATWISVPFRAEAAIINYYHDGDTLMGHSDFSEENHNAPLFSISLGNAAIFLLGGQTRDEKPIPIVLRTGDIVIMKDAARLAYHGVPCVIPHSISPQLGALTEMNAGDDWQPCAQFLRAGGRINMNVRQVYF